MSSGCRSEPGTSERRNPKVPAGAKSSGGRQAVIETDKGPIEVEFFADEQPKAVEISGCSPSTATTMASRFTAS
jgi:hypothetical protein